MLVPIKELINNKYNLERSSVPIRTWSKEWFLPKKAKFENYSINVNTSKKTNVIINNYALWAEIENKKDFIQRTYKENAPKQWGKGQKSRRRFDYKIKGGSIWIKIISKANIFNIKDRIFSFDGRYLRISLHSREIAFWYLSGEGQVRFIILPKEITLNDRFFELIGFLDGEMCKKVNNSGGSSVKISNSEVIIINSILERFKEFFKISIESWTASLTLNNKNSKFSEEDYILKKFWSEKTGIDIMNFTKTTIQFKYNSLFSDKGIIQIRYSDNLFFRILLDIMKNTRKIIIQRKESCAAYIRGVLAGEGGGKS
jgi:hypothetical protein